MIETPVYTEKIVTNSFERLSFKEYLYRKLKQDGYRGILFFGYSMDDNNMPVFATTTYDEYSFAMYKSIEEERKQKYVFTGDRDYDDEIIRKIKCKYDKEEFYRNKVKKDVTGSKVQGNADIHQEMKRWPLFLKNQCKCAIVFDLYYVLQWYDRDDEEGSIFKDVDIRVKKELLLNTTFDLGNIESKIFFLFPSEPGLFEDAIRFLRKTELIKLFDDVPDLSKNIGMKDFKEFYKAPEHNLFYEIYNPEAMVKNLITRELLYGKVPELKYSGIEYYEKVLKKALSEVRDNKSAHSLRNLEYSLEHDKNLIGKLTSSHGKEIMAEDLIPLNLAGEVKKNIIGQDEYIDYICNTIKVNFKHKTTSGRKPLSFFALGTAGIGKTETFETIGRILTEETDGKWGFIKIQLDQYTDKTSVKKLLGADPNYVGYGEPTKLDEIVKHPYNLVLFDEFEKADPAVWGALVGMTGERGRYESVVNGEVSCENVVFAFTSNVSFDKEKYENIHKKDPIKEKLAKKEFLHKSVVDSLKKRGDVSVVEPLIDRAELFCFKGYNYMSSSDRTRLIVKVVKDKVKSAGLNLTEISEGLLKDFYSYYGNSPTGVRYIKKNISLTGLDQILESYTMGNEYSSNIALSGTCGNIDIKETQEDAANFQEKFRNIINTIDFENIDFHEEEIVPFDIEGRVLENIIGQDESVTFICNTIRREMNHKNRKHRKPLAFFALGTVGIGKTETFETIGNILREQSDGRWGFIKIPLNEYAMEAGVQKLLGAEPGYIGYGEPTKLDEVFDHEYNLVLFDEVEKAHPKVWGALMNMIEKGGVYESVKYGPMSCENIVFAFTSNVAFDREAYNQITLEDKYKEKLEKKKFLKQSVTKELSKLGAGEIARPMVDRVQLFSFKGYNEMSPEDKKRLIVKIIKEKVENAGLHLIDMDKDLLENLYGYFKESATGVRSIKDNISVTGIEEALEGFVENNSDGDGISLGGECGSITIREA